MMRKNSMKGGRVPPIPPGEKVRFVDLTQLRIPKELAKELKKLTMKKGGGRNEKADHI